MRQNVQFFTLCQLITAAIVVSAASSAISTSATAASVASSSSPALGGEIDSNGAPHAVLTVEGVERLLSILHGPHGHKRKALRSAGALVIDDLDLVDSAGLGEEIGQLVLVDLVGQIAHVQSRRRHPAEVCDR